jgi:hypothetical protein
MSATVTPTPTRTDLEREVASLRDRLNVALGSVAVARNLLAGWVGEEVKKSSEWKRLFALISAVAKENPMAPPLLARLGWQQGMKEARDLVLEVGAKGEADWKAACQRSIEEIERKLNMNL